MDTVGKIKTGIAEIKEATRRLESILAGGRAKTEFLEALEEINTQTKKMKSAVILHSRARKVGVRTDGRPDGRFICNRTHLPAARRPAAGSETDLRNNKNG